MSKKNAFIKKGVKLHNLKKKKLYTVSLSIQILIITFIPWCIKAYIVNKKKYALFTEQEISAMQFSSMLSHEESKKS